VAAAVLALACGGQRPPDAGLPSAALPAPSAEGAPRRAASIAGAEAGPPPSPGCAPSTAGKTFDVGNEQPYEAIARVPWASLMPGDVVRIHARPEPYREKILVSQSGTEARPLRICGVAGPGGERPVLDGAGATTDRSLDFLHPDQQERGLVILSRRGDQAEGYKPRHVVLEGLELRNASPLTSFRDTAGAVHAYPEQAACVFVERGEHITLRGLEVHGCGNGLFVASGEREELVSRDILIDGNHLYGNGTTTNNTKHHSIYTEAIGIVFQHNRFGPLLAGSLGNQIKDRSVGTVVRYNWFEGGSRAMDLVEPEESYPVVGKLPALRETFVYGNVIAFGARTSSRPIHYGGDNGTESTYRKGTLYFYDNTLAFTTKAEEQADVAVLQLQTDDESADIRNNVILMSGTAHLSWLFEHGTARLGVNWVSRAITPTVERAWARRTGKLELLPGGRTIAGDLPGFVDAAGLDFCLSPASPARGVAGELAPAVPAALRPTRQYRKHHASSPRGAGKDLGALVCEVRAGGER
jgi:hypothetical protein